MQLEKFESTDFSNDNSILNPSPKLSKYGIFVPKLIGLLFWYQTLKLEKLEGVDFKYNKSLFKIPAKKT